MKVVILGFVCFLAAACQARTIIVDVNGAGDFNNIQAAIDDSNDGDTTIVWPGTYVENININGKDVVLTSTDPNNAAIVGTTIIDGGGAGSTITFVGSETADCQLTGFTVTGGYTAEKGGGICGNDTDATITRCVIRDNEAYYNSGYAYGGGGLYKCDGVD